MPTFYMLPIPWMPTKNISIDVYIIIKGVFITIKTFYKYLTVEINIPFLYGNQQIFKNM